MCCIKRHYQVHVHKFDLSTKETLEEQVKKIIEIPDEFGIIEVEWRDEDNKKQKTNCFGYHQKHMFMDTGPMISLTDPIQSKEILTRMGPSSTSFHFVSCYGYYIE